MAAYAGRCHGFLGGCQGLRVAQGAGQEQDQRLGGQRERQEAVLPMARATDSAYSAASGADGSRQVIR